MGGVWGLKRYFPGVECDRVSSYWAFFLCATSSTSGVMSVLAAAALLPNPTQKVTTVCLCAMLTCTSFFYWKRPSPGIVHITDVCMALVNMGWHYRLAVVSPYLIVFYVTPHWSFMVSSMIAHGGGNAPLSAVLWGCVHLSTAVMNIVLYLEVARQATIFY